MIIDIHSHYMPPNVAQHTTFFKQFWSDETRQLKVMDEHHVNQALLLYPTSDAHLSLGGWAGLCQVYNKEISALVGCYPDRFIGAGILPIDRKDLIGQELKRISDLGLKAISLASSYEKVYLDDPIFDEVYAYAQAHALPIHVHAQIMNPIGFERVNDPLLSPVLEYVFDVSMSLGKMMMSGVFTRFPDVKFIFAHYGGVLPVVKERFDSTYAMLRSRGIVKDLGQYPGQFFRNIFFDMSGSKSKATLAAALELTDESHILWGSDFPANANMSDSLMAVSAAILSTEERQKILGINAFGLLKK